jgi:D-glycero-D-manno-heptose 1,7-bisphosphate phosphatase
MSVAVFWDRDKTLIEDPGYISSRDQVRPLPGAAEALKRLSAAGFQNIIVTNQSGLARGLLDEATLEGIHQRVRELFAAQGATIDAIYYCPYLPGDEAVVEAYRQDSDLRKPRPGMLLKAALERKIDLAGSWSIGDSLRDAQAGRAAGCRTIVVAPDPASQAEARQQKEVDFLAASLSEAVDLVLKYSRSAADGSGETGGGPQAAAPDVNATLQEILNFLRMVDRRHQSTDISMAGLVGMLFQALTFVSFIWAAFGVINAEASYTDAMMRLLMTIALQLIAMTFFLLASRR